MGTPPPAVRPPADPEPVARPRVVVKFGQHAGLPYEDGVEEFVEPLGLGPWSALAADFPGISLNRVFASVTAQQIDDVIARAELLGPLAQGAKRYKAPDLRGAYLVDSPPGTNVDALAARVRQWPSVATAYVSRIAGPPSVNPSGNTGWQRPEQRFLNGSDDGVGAICAWRIEGGDGAGQRLVDIERGWWRAHPDLAAYNIPPPIVGVESDAVDAKGHGTSVLGIVAAKDDGNSGLGIVPKLGAGLPDAAPPPIRVASYLRRFVPDEPGAVRDHNIADTILHAAAVMQFGDVLLLEAQTPTPGANVLGPVEIEQVVFDAISVTSASGVVVVEAGGNGKEQVIGGKTVFTPFACDTYRDEAGKLILFRDPGNPDFRDSGAILVSATVCAMGISPPPRRRLARMPHGKRIDCFAWGERIFSTSWDALSPPTPETISFGGTSGAAAIIAGVALSVQGMVQARFGTRLGPQQIRKILADPVNGTLRHSTETTDIGVMPDLCKLAGSLRLVPIVYMRDFVGDTGLPNDAPDVWRSPDVIVRSAPVANPTAAFGAASAGVDDDTLSSHVALDRTNYVFVRARNRGGVAASNVAVDVYWSRPSTLMTPSIWKTNKIGTAMFANVPVGDLLTVAGPIAWSANLPPSGHNCFVALMGYGAAPAPPSDFGTMDGFVRMVQHNPAIAWRNFCVDALPPFPALPSARSLKFIAPGAADEGAEMTLRVEPSLPASATLELRVPTSLDTAFHGQLPFVRDTPNGVLVISLPPDTPTTLPVWGFPPGVVHEMSLRVVLPGPVMGGPYDIAVRQLWGAVSVGGFTWRLAPAPPARPPIPAPSPS